MCVSEVSKCANPFCRQPSGIWSITENLASVFHLLSLSLPPSLSLSVNLSLSISRKCAQMSATNICFGCEGKTRSSTRHLSHFSLTLSLSLTHTHSLSLSNVSIHSFGHRCLALFIQTAFRSSIGRSQNQGISFRERERKKAAFIEQTSVSPKHLLKCVSPKKQLGLTKFVAKVLD